MILLKEPLPVFTMYKEELLACGNFELMGLYAFICLSNENGISLTARCIANNFEMKIEKVNQLVKMLIDKKLMDITNDRT